MRPACGKTERQITETAVSVIRPAARGRRRRGARRSPVNRVARLVLDRRHKSRVATRGKISGCDLGRINFQIPDMPDESDLRYRSA